MCNMIFPPRITPLGFRHLILTSWSNHVWGGGFVPFVLERLFHLEKGQKLSPQQQRAMEVSRESYVPVRLNQVCVTVLPSNTANKEGFCSACRELSPVLAGGVVRTSWWSISNENSWGLWRSFTSSHLWLFIFRGSGGVLFQCHSETALKDFKLTGI